MLNKKTLAKTVKKSLTTALPVIVLGLSSTFMVQTASAGNEAKKAEVAEQLKAEQGINSITEEQRNQLKAQMLSEGKTAEEADAEIEALLKQSETKK